MPKSKNDKVAARVMKLAAAGNVSAIKLINRVNKPSDPPSSPPEKRRHPVTGCRMDTLLGTWLMDAVLLEQYRVMVASHDLRDMKEMSEDVPAAKPAKIANKVGILELNGPTTKYKTSMQAITGGTSTLELTKQLRLLVGNNEVGAIVIREDSPGGTAHGAYDWADEVYKAAKVKPVIIFGHGYMTSGAMLTASQGTYRIATPETWIGSIGVKAVLRDTSKAMEAMGIRVIPVTSGKHKATIEPGVPITEEQIEEIKRDVMATHNMFLDYVSRGIGITAQKLDDLQADVFLAGKAKELGLIDEVGDEERAMEVAFEAAANPKTFLSKAKDGSIKRDQIDPVVTKPIAPPTVPGSTVKGNRTMLTDQQLAEARQLPGAPATMTAENADTVLLDVAKKLSANQKPVKIAKDQAERYASLAKREVSLLSKEDKVNPEQQKALEALCVAENVSDEGTIQISLEKVQDVLKLNKPSGLVEEKSKGQVVAREIPGEPKGDEKMGAKGRSVYGLEAKTATGTVAANSNGNGSVVN